MDLFNCRIIKHRVFRSFFENGLNPITNNPAIFETQPKENLDLDIFYEASQAYPIQLDQSDQIQTNNRKGHLAGAIGDKVRSSSLQGANTLVFSSSAEPEYIDCRVKSWNGDILELDLGLFSIDTLPSGSAADTNDLNDQTLIFSNSGIQIYKEDGSYVSFKIESIEEIIQNGYTSAAGNTYDIISKIRLKPKPNRVGLSYFNCFSLVMALSLIELEMILTNHLYLMALKHLQLYKSNINKIIELVV